MVCSGRKHIFERYSEFVLVIRNKFNDEMTVKELLNEVRSRFVNIYTNSELPFEEIVNVTKFKRDRSYLPLIQFMLAYQNFGTGNIKNDAFSLEVSELPSYSSKFEMTATLIEQDDNIIGTVEYNSDLYYKKTIETFISNYISMLEQIIESPDAGIGTLGFSSPDMDIDIMREYFGMDSNYYNILMSDNELNIDNNYVSSVVNSDDIETTGKKYLDSMMGAIVVLLVLSVVIFIVVMFLLIKMMIDKSTFNISLLKVLGYHENRVKKLYLGSTLYTVIITGIIAVPVCKLAINQIFPYMVYNVAGAFDTSFTIKEYLIITAIVLASYFLSNLILRRYLRKISLAEILKDRE